jgi:HEAT repeat protein
VCAAIACSAGCAPTPEKIAAWKETERGPRKLKEALADNGLSPALRAQALAALVEIGMSSDALAALKSGSDEDRRHVVHDAVPRLLALTEEHAQGPTTPVMREAKDTLFLVRVDASAEDRAQIDDGLIAWTTADLNGRMTQGGQGSEKILAAIGPRAFPRLVELLQPGSASLLPAAQILARTSDPTTRARAADALVQALRRSTAATANESLVQALGTIGGPHATAYLVETAERGTERGRELALFSLAQGRFDGGDPAALGAALRIAGDKAAPGKVREAAFQLAEKIGAPSVPGLLKLMDDGDEVVRWRAVEAALAAGKDKAVVPVLEALSPTRAYKPEDLDSYVVHDLALLGPPAVAPLKDELKSKSWVARVSAVRGLAAVGKADDAVALAALDADATKLKGFPGSATLGSEAKAAAQALRGKR